MTVDEESAPELTGTPRVGAAMDLRFEETVEEFLEFSADLGLEHVELKYEYLHGHPETPTMEELGELADAYDVTLTLHAPFRDWNLGSFNDASRAASSEQVTGALNDAATAGAGAVVVHGGSVPRRYPDWVKRKARRNARRSLVECVSHAAEVGVPLCLENQPRSEALERHTSTPDDLAVMVDAVDSEVDDNEGRLNVTLDVGHARVNGIDWRTFRERFDDRITVVHLHDNDGSADQHRPHPDFEPIVDEIGAPYNVLELKEPADIVRSVESSR